ncbi:hypothetical protein H2O77_05205 [Cobetia sp. 4B]|uniref:hypothetical protein n=1 Tax=Cobetia sp. 4B TaxID=2758724 RepID=UPI001C057631|nr:hypothetical protein [Cobetia sp. 4B]MBR9756433.1 hypothetical protein [Gammaproteobacteria bacterium]MBR9799317.1 hypothetical protein [Gammaproteobacteria bacterium]QWN37859.1 hypothetical protein H2O77_05205 [Cobetia sp. 4B]
MTDQREILRFNVLYSFHVEKMTERFNRRFGDLITFCLVLLGTAVFGSFGNAAWFGIFVATLSAAQLVWRFSEKAGVADAQMKRYANLISDFDELDDAEVRARCKEVSDFNSRPTTALENIAHRNACIYMEWYENDKGLSRFEKVLGFFCGATPMPKKPRQGHGGEAQAAHDETPA